ncbi:MAG: TonB-dependent receptor [Crocinitomicaceae bacterium]|nr:TonB-dependent receptor [Crocinitomicaceae bacterium]
MKLLAFLSLTLLSYGILAQDYTISGNLRDSETGEDIIGARILVKELPGTGAITNVYGFYSLTLPKGTYTLLYKSISFADFEETIELTGDITKDIEMAPEGKVFEKVTVTAVKEDENITSGEMGVEKITMKDIENVPVLFGEKDVLKTMQLLPGVKSAGEGNAGFFVRGGGADQNLILLDEAPVYNASHLLGFFSVFNSDALKDVKLYKGTPPAEFGGRLSSVMDIKMKDGNSKKFSASGGIGLISSKLTIESPIVKDKGSFILSGRRTYADLFLAFSDNENAQNSVLYFYDLNAKANYRIGKKDRIFVSGYFGRDKFGFSDQFGFDWGNATGTMRWNHLYSDKLFGNLSVIFSQYNYKIKFGSEDQQFEIGSEIQDINIKKDFDYYLNSNNTLKFGVNGIFHNFRPGEIETTGFDFQVDDIPNRYSVETAAYIQNEQKVGKRLNLIYGLRYSSFTQLGASDQDSVYIFTDAGEIENTLYYGKWDNIVTYHGLAPRISMSLLLDEQSSLKASAGRTYQYLHLLSNSAASAPTDVWMPSSNNIRPGIADQGSLGYFRNFKENMYEFSTEVYYKHMQNVVDYRDGAEVNLNPTVEGDLLYGIGRAYGVEFLLRKRKGKFSGWLSYTLARTETQIDGINNGEWYAARQDRTHDISIVGIYNLNERLTISGTWVYYTGNAVTFPTAKYEIDGQIVNYFSERNGYRFPDYHRADIGVTLYNKKMKTIIDADTGEEKEVPKKFESSWNFSVYNLYGRENAYSINFNTDPETGVTTATQIALFKFIPSIAFNFKF